MKKLSIFLVVLVAVLMLGSCGNKTPNVPFDNGDSADYANADPTIYGISDMSSTPTMLRLLTDTGDTLSFDLTTARQEGKILGGLQAGDRLAVIPTPDKTAALLVVNQTALLGDWVMPNPLDGSDEVGIRIKEGGIAESIDQPNLSYRTWRLTRGQLEIVQVQEDGSGEEETYLYDIVLLGADSLVYQNADDTFEYTRQKLHKSPEDLIQLEESSMEFKF